MTENNDSPSEGDDCPSIDCSGHMELRTASRGIYEGKDFYGCSEYFDEKCETKYSKGKWTKVRKDPFTKGQKERLEHSLYQLGYRHILFTEQSVRQFFEKDHIEIPVPDEVQDVFREAGLKKIRDISKNVEIVIVTELNFKEKCKRCGTRDNCESCEYMGICAGCVDKSFEEPENAEYWLSHIH